MIILFKDLFFDFSENKTYFDSQYALQINLVTIPLLKDWIDNIIEDLTFYLIHLF